MNERRRRLARSVSLFLMIADGAAGMAYPAHVLPGYSIYAIAAVAWVAFGLFVWGNSLNRTQS